MDKKIWEERIYQMTKDMYFSSSQIKTIGEAVAIAKKFRDEFVKNLPEYYSKESISTEKRKYEKSFDPLEDLSYADEEYKELWVEWLEYKKNIKKQYKTESGVKIAYKTWLNYAENNINLAKAIIKRSIEHSWEGLFPLNDKECNLFGSPNSPYGYIDNDTKQIENSNDMYYNEKNELVINGVVYR